MVFSPSKLFPRQVWGLWSPEGPCPQMFALPPPQSNFLFLVFEALVTLITEEQFVLMWVVVLALSGSVLIITGRPKAHACE